MSNSKYEPTDLVKKCRIILKTATPVHYRREMLPGHATEWVRGFTFLDKRYEVKKFVNFGAAPDLE